MPIIEARSVLFKDLLHCQYCRGTDESLQEYLTPWFGHELLLSLEVKVENCQYELWSGFSKLLLLWKLTRPSSLRFVQFFVQVSSWSAETDRNKIRCKKENPNINYSIVSWLFIMGRISIYSFQTDTWIVYGNNKTGIGVSIKKSTQTNVSQEKVLTRRLVKSRKIYPLGRSL